jgi:centromeric protein E
VLKVSALEIYNEVVKDLLTSDTNPLRLLDDKDVSSLSLILFLQNFFSKTL